MGRVRGVAAGVFVIIGSLYLWGLPAWVLLASEQASMGPPATQAEQQGLPAHDAKKANTPAKPKLHDSKRDAHSQLSVFNDIHVVQSPDLPIKHLKRSAGGTYGKYYVPPTMWRHDASKPCVVYGVGIAGKIAFEAEIARRKCEVHAFDCTSDAESMLVKAAEANIQFHPWCIGTPRSFENTTYTKGNTKQIFEFLTLDAIMRRLGHDHLDMLKMDVEGFEWDLLEQEVIQAKDTRRPAQLLFELHTQAAKPKYVPPALIRGKDRAAVQDLFARLAEVGYSVVSIEANENDPACSEFTLLLTPP
jgi:FkbM family methyltransferase